jgi:L-ascorbate metabolism protein UlaG (beta-lactamase superfamily)
MAITITWHGHNTFTLDINGTRVVVDPFFADNNPIAKTRVGDVAADFILLTHGHEDHFADTIPLVEHTGAQVITNFEICTWLRNHGFPNTHAMNTGGGHNFPFGHLRMTRALHSSGLPDGSYGGDPAGYVITADNKRIYIAGDTALFSDMSLIGAQGLDLAILPIGDNYTMGPDDALQALDYLKPKAVIPCHYNTWPIIAVDVAEWARRVNQETYVEPIVLDIDQSHTF